MPEAEQDFDLQILRDKEGGDRYRVNVIQSPAGEADGEFNLPFSEGELNELFRGLGHMRRATRGAASPEVAKAREFGTQIFDRVFSGDVRDCLNNSRGRAQAAGRSLRIRLRLTKVPELLDLPWELFFDRRYNRFVALDDGMTLVRHLPVAEPVVPMRVEAPLRVLVAISNPRGDLNTEQEWAKLTGALTGLSERGLVEVERLQPATFDGLGAKLRAGIFHVLHFVGHGEYDAATKSGFLSFELKPTGEKRVGATRLGDLLRPFHSLRLVVLNACEGGRTSREDAFAGVAQSLVQSAIPAVVAMQFPVTDAAAIVFADAFYAGLAAGRPVDLALADARRDVNLKGEEGDIEWATPVLYMRGSGALFDVGAACEPTTPNELPLPPRKKPPKSTQKPTTQPLAELPTIARESEPGLENARPSSASPISTLPANEATAAAESPGRLAGVMHAEVPHAPDPSTGPKPRSFASVAAIASVICALVFGVLMVIALDTYGQQPIGEAFAEVLPYAVIFGLPFGLVVGFIARGDAISLRISRRDEFVAVVRAAMTKMGLVEVPRSADFLSFRLWWDFIGIHRISVSVGEKTATIVGPTFFVRALKARLG